MFRYSLSLLVLTLFLNQLNPAACRSLEKVVAKKSEIEREKREGMFPSFARCASQIKLSMRFENLFGDLRGSEVMS